MFDSVKLLIPLTAIIFGSLLPIAIVWLLLRHQQLRTQLIYETALKLAEKGQPVPTELFAHLNPTPSDLRRGVVLAMFGLALCIALYETGAPWTFGLIPLFMGLGYLAVRAIENKRESRPAS